MRKKMALITPGFLPVPAVKGGGGEMLITKLIEQNEVEKKFDIDLYTIEDKQINTKKYKQTNIIFIKTSYLNNLFARIVNKIANILNKKIHINPYGNKVSILLKEKKYDYLLIENNMYIFKKINESYPYKCKKIFHLHNDIGGIDKPQELCKYIGENADLILTVSEYLKKHYLKLVKVNKIDVLYNCVDINLFKYHNYSRKEYRNKYKINKNDFVFQYIGRISEEKGLLPLVKAFKKVAKNNKNIKLCIVGDIWFGSKKNSPYFTKIKDEIISIANQVIFVGSQPITNIPKFMSMADCIIVPTICEEAFGLVAIEAMATKRALIVSESGGLPEVVDYSCAKIVSKENFVENLKKAMMSIIKEQKKAKQMGIHGYNRIISKSEFQEQNYFTNFYNKIKEIDD